MALRRREAQRQQDLWISTSEIARSPGHVFYQRLSELLNEANFDRLVEDSVLEFDASDGRTEGQASSTSLKQSGRTQLRLHLRNGRSSSKLASRS